MIIARNKKDLENYLNGKRLGNQIGFVPTMGSFHLGHLSLIKQSKKKKCITCVSIFINPAQFNNFKDFKFYPKNEKKDLKILKKVGCDIVFIPNVNEIYPKGIIIEKKVKKFRNILCDNYRPDHFDGVTTVVSKLFKIVKPNFVFFGEKDFQQLKIICELIKVEKMPIKIHSCPSVRDKNGISLSSRYKLFNKDQKIKFRELSKVIINSIKEIKKGNNISKVIFSCKKNLKKRGINEIDYFEVRTNKNLRLRETSLNSRLFIALHLDNVRIIDNFILK